MNIGQPVRTLVVEPIISPVPDGDLPGHLAELPPSPTTPTPGAAAATTDPAVASAAADLDG